MGVSCGKEGCRLLVRIRVDNFVTPPVRTPEHGVDESCCSGSILFCQIDRLVNCGRYRNPVEKKHLVQPEPKEQENDFFELCRRSLGKLTDNMVESPLLAKGSVDQLSIKTPIGSGKPPFPQFPVNQDIGIGTFLVDPEEAMESRITR